MSFSAITSGEIVTGKPVANTTMTKVKDNFDNHESRIGTLEAGTSVSYPPIIMRVNGIFAQSRAITNVLKTTCNFNLQVTGIRLYIDGAGASGSCQIDIKKSHAGGAYTSLFTTKPLAAYTDGNDFVTTNQVLDSGQTTLSAGDLIRLDVDSLQPSGSGFYVRIDFVGV